MNKLTIIIIGFALIIINGCTGGTTGKTESFGKADFKAGEAVYKAKCTICHQTGGMGVAQVFPPLANNPTMTGDKTYLIKVILDGLTGPVEVNGVKYNGVMTPFSDLSDKEVADVLSYLRGNFGNNGDAVTEQEVKAYRIKQ